MNEHQKEVIKRNLPDLIKLTRCNSEVITNLMSVDIFSQADLEELSSIGNQQDKALQFYTRIQTRDNAFIPLLRSLRETRQTGAVRILKAGLELSPVSLSNPNDNDSLDEHTALNIGSAEIEQTEENLSKPALLHFNRYINIYFVILITCLFVCGAVVLIFKNNSSPHDGESNKEIWSTPEMLPEKETTLMVTDSKVIPEYTFQKPTYATEQTIEVPTSPSTLIDNTMDCGPEKGSTDIFSSIFKGCPERLRCSCWADSANRDRRCKEKNYPKRWDFEHFGVVRCYCCGKF